MAMAKRLQIFPVQPLRPVEAEPVEVVDIGGRSNAALVPLADRMRS